jgi:glucose-6-phosphate-specific signal transduction histidine kinase
MMATMEEFKSLWEENKDDCGRNPVLDHDALQKIVKTRAKKNLNVVMKYFWASFTLQLIVYALLCHVMVKYGSDKQTLLIGLAGIILFIPFTFMLMRKFKAMAQTRVEEGHSGESIHRYVTRQHTLLESFYRFKKKYELMLVPLSTAIGTFLTFELYVPGGVLAYQMGAFIIFCAAVISCVVAIISENKRSFEKPLNDLQKIIDDYKA